MSKWLEKQGRQGRQGKQGEQGEMKTNNQQAIKDHTELEIFRLSKTFPVEERYSLTDQIRRSSRKEES